MARANSKMSEPMSKQIHILLIDDNPDDRALVIRQLKREYPDLEVQQVVDAQSFKRELLERSWDIVITDFHVGWSDGLKILLAVKASRAECPVIMFTGTGSEEIAVEAMKAGLDDYVIKSPKHFVRLLTAVRLLLERAHQRQAVSEAETRYQSLFQDVPVGLFRLIPSGRIVEANPAFVQMLGYRDKEELRSINALDLCVDSDALKQWQERLRREGTVRDVELRVRRGDGRVIWVRNSAHAVSRADGQVLCYDGFVEDITDRREAEERLSYLANHDLLTGLPNRALLNDRLHQAMIDADRHERLVGVMFIDLDHFKNINDTLGHETGDRLLKSVADRLSTCVREGDTVARLSGDEFTLVLAGMAHVDDAARVAQKLIDSFSVPFRMAERELFVSPSVGITLYPFDDNSIEGLLKNADIAMYRAKEQGRNTYQFYAAEMTSKAFERLALESNLRRALDKNEFLLYYQPIVSFRSGEIIGVEALMRWAHPELGMVPPAQFIPLAEDTGLIEAIGEWVLHTACAQHQAIRKMGIEAPRFAVNISARQFRQRGFNRVIEQALVSGNMKPGDLELELTESMLMHNVDGAAQILQQLAELGVQLCIDDFGIGYSSLSYLKRFPIDWLKIDQSFVRDITTDPDDAAITTAIIAMARSLNIKVIAEGVETESQFAFLRSRDCDAMQGHLFSCALGADDLVALLKSGQRGPVVARP